MKRFMTCGLIGTIVFMFFLNVHASAATRGIRVKAKTRTGVIKEIPLYSDYYALVIGCEVYRDGWPPLPNAAKDAREVAGTLQHMGWTVRFLENPDSNMLQKALNRLVITIGKKKDRGVFLWYSGHGYTIREADGTPLGYIIPVDAPLPGKGPMGFEEKAVNMRRIETVSKRILSRHVLMVFDSCFSGAIFALNRAAPSPYIQEKVSKPVREFITAGSENETVPDRSVFKTVFLQGISDGYADLNRDGYVTGEELGAYLQEKVVNYSNKAQHPQYGKINNPKLDKGDFVFSHQAAPMGVQYLDSASNQSGEKQKTQSHLTYATKELNLTYATKDDLPTRIGDDVLVPDLIIRAIPGFDPDKPVYAACDINGWFVRGPYWASEEKKAATRMIHEGKWWRARDLRGKRFHPVQLDNKGKPVWAKLEFVYPVLDQEFIDNSGPGPCLKVR